MGRQGWHKYLQPSGAKQPLIASASDNETCTTIKALPDFGREGERFAVTAQENAWHVSLSSWPAAKRAASKKGCDAKEEIGR